MEKYVHSAKDLGMIHANIISPNEMSRYTRTAIVALLMTKRHIIPETCFASFDTRSE